MIYSLDIDYCVFCLPADSLKLFLPSQPVSYF